MAAGKSKSNGNGNGIDYDAMIETILEGLETTGRWLPEWKTVLQRNLDGRRYRGANVFILAHAQIAKRHPHRHWGTRDAIEAAGGKVKAGETGVNVVWCTRVKVIDETTDEEKRIWRSGTHCVYNIAQTDGLPALPDVDADLEPSNMQDVWDGWLDKPELLHGEYDPAYSPTHDRIVMPAPEAFTDKLGYYAALFHEASHATGHASRLKRRKLRMCGKKEKSREELVAEMGSVLLLAHCGVEPRTNDIAYIKSWASHLRNHTKECYWAFSQAWKAMEYILNETQEVQA